MRVIIPTPCGDLWSTPHRGFIRGQEGEVPLTTSFKPGYAEGALLTTVSPPHHYMPTHSNILLSHIHTHHIYIIILYIIITLCSSSLMYRIHVHIYIRTCRYVQYYTQLHRSTGTHTHTHTQVWSSGRISFTPLCFQSPLSLTTPTFSPEQLRPLTSLQPSPPLTRKGLGTPIRTHQTTLYSTELDSD